MKIKNTLLCYLMLPLLISCGGETYSEIIDSYLDNRYREQFLTNGDLSFSIDTDIWTYEISKYPDDGLIKNIGISTLSYPSEFSYSSNFGGASFVFNTLYLTKEQQNFSFKYQAVSEEGRYSHEITQNVKVNSYEYFIYNILWEMGALVKGTSGSTETIGGEVVTKYKKTSVSSGHFYKEYSTYLNMTTYQVIYKCYKYEKKLNGPYNEKIYQANYDLISGDYSLSLHDDEFPEFESYFQIFVRDDLNPLFRRFNDNHLVHDLMRT